MTPSTTGHDLAGAGGHRTAPAAGDGPGCVTVRSHRRAAAVGTGPGTEVRIRRLADHVERTTAALVFDCAAGPEASPVRHAAVDECGTRALRAVSQVVEVECPDTHGAAGPDAELVMPPHIDREPALLVEAVARQLPRDDDLKLVVEAHVAVENRLLLPANGPSRHETLHTSAVVVDVLRAGRRVAEADAAWSGDIAYGLDRLREQVEQALARAAAPPRTAAPRVQLLLIDGSAGAFLHEVCGHLLESTRHRPSLLAGHLTRQVAYDRLTIDDNPRHAGGFGAHQHTMLGTPTRRRPLLAAGRLAGLLEDNVDGPWRAEDAWHRPQPRMSHLELAPAASSAALDSALGDTSAPVIHVHRLGFGSLDHRDGTVVLEVKDATKDDGRTRLEPFLVTAKARHLLQDVRAVGCAGTLHTWSAYCLAGSGSLPVGATTPTLLTGPVRTLPHRRLTPPRPAVRHQTRQPKEERPV
ncbi:metallopeptidase TldD-related protein [Streptomyces sp. NBC_01176]|uniref:metallopeptidase TldD-related protein n=1 Tax=Streptomyces sp. NBC_01176 TaxID=2903760 RepID=UPI00386AB490|nr:metallopeptidase TldD-related protein [Streptomyces sp. NBC_01176]WSS89378.1 metallopeptidase TldD-related protein [Streptomyces sp. NBC_01176]